MISTDAVYDRMMKREKLSTKYVANESPAIDMVPLNEMDEISQDKFMDLKIITYLVDNQSYTPELFEILKSISKVLSQRMFLSSLNQNIM